MKTLLVTLFASLLLVESTELKEINRTGDPVSNDKIQVILRLDDIGFCHSVNMACKKLAEAGIPYSTSLMTPCPWYLEAVDVLKEYPEISVGVHLTLNSEWKNYKWGPVLGQESVPSLVNEKGHFFHNEASFFENKPNISEVEKEFRAQIDRALSEGITVDYLDAHMYVANYTRELREVVVKLANEYELGISSCFGEEELSTYTVPFEQKKDAAIATLSELEPGKTYLYVIHVGLDTPEMSVLEQTGENVLKDMSKHRTAQLNMLLSDEFKEIVEEKNIELITYREYIEQNGLESMNIQDFLLNR